MQTKNNARKSETLGIENNESSSVFITVHSHSLAIALGRCSAAALQNNQNSDSCSG